MKFNEKASYIKGLAEGLNINGETAEGKLILALIDLAGDMSAELQRLNDYCEELDECLGEVEEYLADEDDCCDNDCECDDCCDDGCEEYYEAECPNCGKTFEIDGDALDEDEDAEIICPHCGQKLYYDDEEEDQDK